MQDGVAAGLEMLDIADRPCLRLGARLQQFFQACLPLGKRQAAQILAVGEQQVERIEDQLVGLAVGNRSLQRGEIRHGAVIEGDDLAVDQHVGQRGALFRDGAELLRPVQPLAGLERRLAVLDAQLHAVAVELDLVAPPFPVRRPFDRRAEFGRDEIRDRGDFPALRFFLGRGIGNDVIAAIRMPHRIRPRARGLCRHERLGRPALAARDLRHAASRGDGFILVQDVVGLALFGVLIVVLDQEPVGALAACAVVAHPHQHPAAMQLVAMQGEFQVAFLEALFGIVGFPITTVPELHGAAAILALRNRAFEIAVVERMVLDLDRQPLVVRIERGPPGHGPGLEDAVEFEPQIVMQARRIVLLDHEPALLRRLDRRLAAGLGGLLEIAFFSGRSRVFSGPRSNPPNEYGQRRTARHARNRNRQQPLKFRNFPLQRRFWRL